MICQITYSVLFKVTAKFSNIAKYENSEKPRLFTVQPVSSVTSFVIVNVLSYNFVFVQTCLGLSRKLYDC